MSTSTIKLLPIVFGAAALMATPALRHDTQKQSIAPLRIRTPLMRPQTPAIA